MLQSSETRIEGDIPYELPSQTAVTTKLTMDFGFLRGEVRNLGQDVQSNHGKALRLELEVRAREKSKNTLQSLLVVLSDYGFAWRDIARMIGVSVPAVQKWRQGEFSTPENLVKVAEIVALCDLIQEQYLVRDPASWMDVPLAPNISVTPMTLVMGGRKDLVLEFASGQENDTLKILSNFDPNWKDRYESNFGGFVAEDGVASLRLR